VDGGAGFDLYSASASNLAIVVNIDAASHNFGPFAGPLIAGSKSLIGVNVDNITGFENVDGGTKDDFIHGNAAANEIKGNAGADTIFGFTGNDTLIGGAGADTLLGGAGADLLTGGTEADTFAFTSKTDSTFAKAGRDVITDFVDGTDKISFAFLDANSTNGAGIDDFTSLIINNSFTGAGQQLRVYFTTTGWMLEGDVNGDEAPDFAIEIVDATHVIAWTLAGDFLL
jgi:serralysin